MLSSAEIVPALALAFAVGTAAFADANNHTQSALSGKYLEYSGTLDDMGLPKKSDTKVSVEITGKLAQDIFSRVRPVGGPSCVDKTIEVRERGDLMCLKDSKAATVSCFIGVDLRTGKSIAGTIC